MKLPINYEESTPAVRREARLEYITKQDGCCWHCGDLLDGEPNESVTERPMDTNLFPEHFLTYPIHLHHCHETGLSIGAVHARCNADLWQYHGQ